MVAAARRPRKHRRGPQEPCGFRGSNGPPRFGTPRSTVARELLMPLATPQQYRDMIDATGAAAYLSGPAENMAAGAQAFAEFAHVLAERSPVLIALHTDHATAERVD